MCPMGQFASPWLSAPFSSPKVATRPSTTKVISDANKVFELFRIGGDAGFGWERERLARENPGRLRVFAQNATWANENRARVEEMLASGAPEVDLRKQVQEAVKAKKEDREEAPEISWHNVIAAPLAE